MLFMIIRVISRKRKNTLKCEFINASCIHSDKDYNFLLKKKFLDVLKNIFENLRFSQELDLRTFLRTSWNLS